MNITLIAGARPNFMKIAPVIYSIHKAQEEEKNMRILTDVNFRLWRNSSRANSDYYDYF